MASPFIVHYAVDWTRVLDDLAHVLGEEIPHLAPQRQPLGTPTLADALGIPRGTLRGWLDGAEPRHSDGEKLLDRWCSLTGRTREVAPLVRRSFSAAGR